MNERERNRERRGTTTIDEEEHTMLPRRMISVGCLVLALLGGMITTVTVGPTLRERVQRGFRIAELAAAYPPVRLNEAIAAFTTISISGHPGDVVRSVPETDAHTWFGQSVEVRWQWYTQPTQARVRLLTHVELVALGVGLLALLLRTVGRAMWFLLMLLVMRRRAQPGTSHGSAHWAGRAELTAMRPRPRHADLVLGRVGRQLVALPEHEQYEHLLLVAPTGAGKTSGVILPNLLAEPGTRSLVITDPKRELLRKSTPALLHRYPRERVWTLDFLDPRLSRGYNPLAYVTDAASADLFAQTWVRNTGESKDAFWSNAARTLIGAAALHLVATDEITPPLIALVDLLCGNPAEQVSAQLRESPVPEVRRLARGFLANMAKNERLLGSVFTELPPRFTCLNLPEVCAVTGTNEIDFASLAETPTALYLALDPQYSRTLAPLTACFFLHFFTTLTNIAKTAPSGALPVSVLAYLDEFGTVGHIPEFANRMATVRSAGIGCLLVVQDLAQLKKSYGEEDADTILSNSTTKLCLGRVTNDDAEYFSKLAGTTTVMSANRSASRALLVPWEDRGNRGQGEAQRALITPDELRTMRDEVFVVAGHHHPVRARQRRYYEDPTLARLVPDLAGTDPLLALQRVVPLPIPMLASPPVSRDGGEEGLMLVEEEVSLRAEVSGTEITNERPISDADNESAPDSPALASRCPVSVALNASPTISAAPAPLTEAEIALLGAMARVPDASSATLGEGLGIAASTVRKRQAAIREKLGGGNRHIVTLARDRGVMPDGNTLTVGVGETEAL